MRCFFVRDGHVMGFEPLDPNGGDEECIKQAHLLFDVKGKATPAPDGFEVWDQKRLVFRFPSESFKSTE